MSKIKKSFYIRMLICMISILGVGSLFTIPIMASEPSTISAEAESLDEPDAEGDIPDLVPEDSLEALLEQISVSPESTYLEKPEGNAEVIENTGENLKEKYGKEFFTIRTRDEHVYYLVIDHDLTTDNVYFLDQVTERDLAGMLPTTENEGEVLDIDSGAATVNPETQTEKTEKENITKDAQEPTDIPEEESGGKSPILIMIFVIAVFGIGYYVKIYKPKKRVLDDALDFDEDFAPDFDTEDENFDQEEEDFLYQDPYQEDEPEENPRENKRIPKPKQKTQSVQKEPVLLKRTAEHSGGNILLNGITFLLKVVFGSALIGLISLGFTVLLNENLKNIVFETFRNCFK